MKVAVWWIARGVLATLAWPLSLLSVALVALTQWIASGSDDAHLRMELAAAEARTRRDRKQIRGRRK